MTSAIPKGPTYSKLPDKQPAIRSTGLSFAPHRAHLGSLNAADISFLLRFGCIGTNRCYESVVGVGGSEPLWLSPSIAWAPIFATRFRGRPDSGLEHPKANRLQVSLWCCRALVVTVALPKPHIALLARSGEEWKSCSSVGDCAAHTALQFKGSTLPTMLSSLPIDPSCILPLVAGYGLAAHDVKSNDGCNTRNCTCHASSGQPPAQKLAVAGRPQP